MLENIFDLSLIFIVLALFGFLIRDAYYWGFLTKPVNVYRDNTSILFHYISIALMIGCFCLILLVFILASPQPENLITQFFKNLIEINIEIERLANFSTMTTEQFYRYLSVLFLPSFFYVSVIIIVNYIGLFSRYFNENWIQVENMNFNKRTFPRIIAQNETFIFFEKEKSPREWEAIQKSDIKSIGTVKHKSQATDYYGYLRQLWTENKKIFFAEIFLKLYLLILLLILIFPLIFR